MTVPLVRLPRRVRIRYGYHAGIHTWTAQHRTFPDHPIGQLKARALAHEHAFYLQDFAVDHPWRRRGIGSTLLANALATLHNMGHTAYLFVERGNTDAQRLYARLGGQQDDNDSRDYYRYDFYPPHPALAAL